MREFAEQLLTEMRSAEEQDLPIANDAPIQDS